MSHKQISESIFRSLESVRRQVSRREHAPPADAFLYNCDGVPVSPNVERDTQVRAEPGRAPLGYADRRRFCEPSRAGCPRTCFEGRGSVSRGVGGMPRPFPPP